MYSVYGEMIKTNRTEKSMSNDAINHYIKLTVDGRQVLPQYGFPRFGVSEISLDIWPSCPTYDNGYTLR